MQWCFVSEMKLRYCVLFRKWSRSLVFCFGNEAAVLCFVSETCGPGSCGCPPPLRIIPAQKFLQIRMHFTAENHPCAEISSNQDAFLLQKASLFGKIRCQGLFPRDECILIRKNSLPGIIVSWKMHPWRAISLNQDAFRLQNASLIGYFIKSGCIPLGSK